MPTPVSVAVAHSSTGTVATIAKAVAEDAKRAENVRATAARVRTERVVKSPRAAKTGPAAES